MRREAVRREAHAGPRAAVAARRAPNTTSRSSARPVGEAERAETRDDDDRWTNEGGSVAAARLS
jgi:hypothetical protein